MPKAVVELVDVPTLFERENYMGDRAFELSDLMSFLFGPPDADDSLFVEHRATGLRAFGDFLLPGEPVAVSLIDIAVRQDGEISVTLSLAAAGKLDEERLAKELSRFLKEYGRPRK